MLIVICNFSGVDRYEHILRMKLHEGFTNVANYKTFNIAIYWYKKYSSTVKYFTIFSRSNMERQPEDNPFLALFEPLQVQAPISPHRPKQSTPPISRDLSNEESTKILQRVNTLIEDIFAITINPYGFLGRDSNDPGTLFDYIIHLTQRI